MKIVKHMALLCCAFMLFSCGTKSVDSKDVRNDYGRSLDDSISVIKAEIDSCRQQASVLQENVDVWMRDFTTVANPREAGAYTILTSWKNRYPLKSTGLVARIDDQGQFQLIAVLSGASFDRIVLNTPTESVSSQTVPNDQALNYRTGGLTTVLFAGPEADSVGQVIADNELNGLSVEFMQGRVVSTWQIPAEYAKTLSYTYMLYKIQRDLATMERRIPMLQEKIKILRIHKNDMDTDTVTAN